MTKNYNDLGVEFKYLIVNDMDQKFGLWVNTVGFQSIQPDSPYPLKDHPSGYFFNAQKGRVLREYQLVYITKGRGLFSSETTPEKQVCKGRLMVLFPGQWHTYHPYRQTGWNEYYIGFEGPVIDNLVKGGFLSKDNQVLEVGLNEELVSLFSRALEIAEADKISSQQYLGGIVLHIVGMILSISKNKIFEVGDVDQKIEQAKIIMNENVFKDIDPEELAMKLNISYSWFRKVFKDYTGYAPAKYFQELKLRKPNNYWLVLLIPLKRFLLCSIINLPNISFHYLKNAQGLPHWNIVLLVGRLRWRTRILINVKKNSLLSKLL